MNEAPPQDLEAESALLGAMLVNPSSVGVAAEALTPDDFYKPSNGAIFTEILRTWTSHSDGVDAVTISAKLPEHKDYIFHLSESCPVASNASRYAEIVKRFSVQRQLIRAGQEIVEMGHGSTDEPQLMLDAAEAKVYSLRPTASGDTGSLKSVGESIIKECMEGVAPPSTPTGYPALDAVIGGFYEGNLILIGARPGCYKTTLALNIARHVAKRGTVLFFSLEMSKAELVERTLSSLALVNHTQLRRRNPGPEQLSRLYKAHDELAKLDMEIVDNSSLTLLSLKSRARQWCSRRRLSLVVVDYLQLLRYGSKQESRFSEVSAISRDLKGLARELSVPILALSQLNRESESTLSDGKPKLSHLRESGSLEQDADLVLLLSKPKDEELKEVTVDVAKNRHGRMKTVALGVVPQYNLISESGS